MKNLLLFLLSVIYMYGDTLDNMILEQLRQEKLENEKIKPKKAIPHTQDTTEKSTSDMQHTENKDSQSSDSHNSQTATSNDTTTNEKHAREYKDSKPSPSSEIQHTYDTTKDKKPFYWFIGGGIGSSYKVQYQRQDSQMLDVSLHAGVFYYVGQTHGIKGYILASYSTIAQYNLFSAGAGVDYFYTFERIGIGMFGGLYGAMPINRSITQDADVVVYAGINIFINKENRIEVRIGYPILHDSQISRIFTYGLAYQYIFGRKK